MQCYWACSSFHGWHKKLLLHTLRKRDAMTFSLLANCSMPRGTPRQLQYSASFSSLAMEQDLYIWFQRFLHVEIRSVTYCKLTEWWKAGIFTLMRANPSIYGSRFLGKDLAFELCLWLAAYCHHGFPSLHPVVAKTQRQLPSSRRIVLESGFFSLALMPSEQQGFFVAWLVQQVSTNSSFITTTNK
jgi:hypothetical protein